MAQLLKANRAENIPVLSGRLGFFTSGLVIGQLIAIIAINCLLKNCFDTWKILRNKLIASINCN